jgi:hypothetical protein
MEKLSDREWIGGSMGFENFQFSGEFSLLSHSKAMIVSCGQ